MTTLTPRIESKYCVPEAEAASAFRVAGLFLERDRGLTGPQRIQSLYFDSPTLTFLTWQRTRRSDRFKLRLRAYGAGPANVVYAEVKSKKGGWVYKRRAPIAADLVAFVLDGAARPSSGGFANGEDEDLGFFHERLQAFAAMPQVLLRCERESLRGMDEDSAVGVTVDRDLQFQRSRSLGFDVHPGAWSGLPLPGSPDGSHSCAILEIKRGENAPAWLRSLARSLEPYRRSFSKYERAMRQALAGEGCL